MNLCRTVSMFGGCDGHEELIFNSFCVWRVW